VQSEDSVAVMIVSRVSIGFPFLLIV
jgi:hypothetical protein